MKVFTGKELFDAFTGLDRSMRALEEIVAPKMSQQSEVGSGEWVEELEAAVTILEKLGQPPTSGEGVMLAGAAQHAQQTLERVLQLIRAGSSTQQ